MLALNKMDFYVAGAIVATLMIASPAECLLPTPAFELLFGPIGELLVNISNSLNGPNVRDPASDRDVEEYDFIIIGAGAAGSVLANRLSEIPDWKILLLEAGSPENPTAEIPEISEILQLTEYNWRYQTIPQESGCLGMIDEKCNIPSGRGLGGSSAIGNSVYARGAAQDYDIWSEMVNSKNWSFDEVLPYHKKSEDVHLRAFDVDFHGLGGPNYVEDARNPSRIRQAFLSAAAELGYPILDYNGKKQIGFSRTQVSTRKGRRHSVAKGYLETIRNRPNLIIKTLSNVTRILINPDENQAEAVEYVRNGRTLLARNRKEVVLSAGAINSPQILMLSGVGPKEHLEEIGVQCLKDLPVGRNLRDHVAFLGLNFVLDQKREQEDFLVSLYDWLVKGHGPLTSCGVDAIGYVNSGLSADPEHADVELDLMPINLARGYHLVQPVANFKREIYDSLWKEVEGSDTFTIMVTLSRPRSTGYVKLRSKNNKDHPIVNPRYLSDPADVEIILRGIRKALELRETSSFGRIYADLNKRKVYGCETHDFGTDDYWRCAIPRLQVSASHYSGSNRMGSGDDAEAVVDERLRVMGMKGLRVIDASVIPNSNTGHVLGPVLMLAEKGADLIKEDWSELFF